MEQRQAGGSNAKTTSAEIPPFRDDASSILSYLFSGPLTFGGIGYGLDYWLGTTFVVAIGILLGIAMSIYVIWLRYGGS
ncbi:AtpZ/AtpI family protein [Austwickia chelonae]|uniref:AtpZ/AtpI family protein n=1 Tax=Austwickia chelonae TaxID=100225 RepID=UPI000E259977|nr:AtpZ/AtpI family protein [Austwickia chelonae]